MIDQRLGVRLRRLPGVLDCSVIDGGVALLVHPEVDLRVLKARAQAVMFELGDERPLLLMGGMTGGSADDGRRSPSSLGAFAVAVLCLLALMPTAAPTGPRPPFSGPLAAVSADTLTPELARPRLLSAASRRASVGARVSAGAGSAAPAAANASAGPGPVPEVSSAEGHRHAGGRGRAGVPSRPTAPLPSRPPATGAVVDAVSLVRLPQVSSIELFRGPGQSGLHHHGPKP